MQQLQVRSGLCRKGVNQSDSNPDNYGGNRGGENLQAAETREEIPKSMILECMRDVSRIKVKAPIRRGEVILENVAGTGVNVVATRDLH